MQLIPAVSNAEAARLAGEDAESAAIASDRAAECYALAVLAAGIEDDVNNTTRFFVLGQHAPPPSGKDKTSLVMSGTNRPGTVHQLLTPLAVYEVSMTRFESRPSRAGLWEYFFFVDVEGHQRDDRVGRALKEIAERAAFFKVFGSYPVAAV